MLPFPVADRSWRYDALLLAIIFIWGLNFAVIKVALAALHPFTVNIARFLIAAVTLAGMLAWEGHRHGEGVREAFAAPLRDHLRAVVTLGITGNILYQSCFILGVNLTAAGSAALIMASTPVWTALMARVGGQERLSQQAWLGLAVSLAGTVVVILAGGRTLDLGIDDLGSGKLLGNLLMLAAALFWGLYTVLSKPMMTRGASPNGLAFYAVLVALPGMYAFHRLGPGPADWAALTPPVWASLVFSGALSIGAAYGLWNVAVRQVGASYATAYGNLVPFVAIGSGAWLLGEAVTIYQVLGGLLIIGGLLLLRRSRTTPRPPSQPIPSQPTSAQPMRSDTRVETSVPDDAG